MLTSNSMIFFSFPFSLVGNGQLVYGEKKTTCWNIEMVYGWNKLSEQLFKEPVQSYIFQIFEILVTKENIFLITLYEF